MRKPWALTRRMSASKWQLSSMSLLDLTKQLFEQATEGNERGQKA